MARCYLSGIEFPIENDYVLDKPLVYREIRALKAKAEDLTRLLDLLGPADCIVLCRKTTVRRRLVCADVARALSAGFGERGVFMSWRDFRAQRLVYIAQAMQREPRYADLVGSLDSTALNRGARLVHEALPSLKPEHRRDVQLQKEMLSIACRLPAGSTVHVLVAALQSDCAIKEHVDVVEPDDGEQPD